ncbi:hypothetical protein [Vreelandella titanicae]|uniref:hypothetical protein n=1 Tax=Vreelandella titanicae TaxID=664683 RepID=UPI0015939E99|nr:hypothetical protein [Halomonas titanicae]NVE91536.1 hypothetical protein [Halomonas titanicae]
MITAPTVPDFQADNFKVNDRRQAVIKDNNRNRKLDQFATELQEMVDLANVEFQFVAETRTVITQKAGQVASDRQHVDQQKGAIDTTAGQVSANAQQVASDRQVVAQDRQASQQARQGAETAQGTATQAAQASSQSANAAQQAKENAENLYSDLSAVEAAKNASQQAATTASQQRQLAQTARVGAEDALQATEAVLQEANADIDEKLADYVPRTGADLGSNDLKARLTHNSGYMYIGAYNSSYGTGQLRVYWNDTDKQLNMGGAELINVSLNASLLDKGTVPIARIASTGSRFDSSTEKLLQANAMNNHRTSGDHDARYARIEVANVFAGDLEVSKDNPWLTLDSPASGEVGVEQCAGISIGESGKKGAAALHLTYTGDGRGHIGMGVVDVATGLPENEVIELFYQSKDIRFFGNLNLPESVTLGGFANGVKITNGSNGYVEIGNRNTSNTHYNSSAGRHYFYGEVRAQNGFTGDGSGVTNVNAAKLDGLLPSSDPGANTAMTRNSSGDTWARLFRSTYTSTSSNIAVIYTAAKSDGTDFMRPSTPAQVKSALGVDVPTGSNSNGRYYLYPDGRLVMQCGQKTFSQDPASNRRLLASVTLPYTPLGSAEHYVTVNPSSDAGDYTNASSPFDVSGVLVKPGRLSSGTVVEVRILAQEGRTFATSATTVAPVLIESRWK